MSQLFLFPQAVRRDPAVERWLDVHRDELGSLARFWSGVVRGTGEDVRELLHDGRPTFCVGAAAFAYVDAYRNHVSVGFFRGAELPDPDRLLEGAGRLMRHVKLRSGRSGRDDALAILIATAYDDMKNRLEGTEPGG